MLGTGKYRTREEMRAALEASGAEIITVALRRIDFDDPASRSILEDIDTSRFAILPNTAGCKTAEEAVRIARMADAMGLGKWVKLEVIPDAEVPAARSDRHPRGRPARWWRRGSRCCPTSAPIRLWRGIWRRSAARR